MKLGNNIFPNVWCAVGAVGFMDEGYPFDPILRLVGKDWTGVGRAYKTVTAYPNEGNMPLEENGLKPRQFIPDCVVSNLWNGHTLNAVGLSNRGLEHYLSKRYWQTLDQPFSLSHYAILGTAAERRQEDRRFVELVRQYGPFKAPILIQRNWGCPNTSHKITDLLDEIGESHETLAELGYPVFANFGVTTSVKILKWVVRETACGGLWLANTVPWDDIRFDRQRLFGSEISPLKRRGFKQPGGGSGPSFLAFALDRTSDLRDEGYAGSIIVGNGIQLPNDVVRARKAGATGIAYGTGANLRTCWMRSTLRTAFELFAEEGDD